MDVWTFLCLNQNHQGIIPRIAARAARFEERGQQKLDRDAFHTLLGREDWVYRDMGVHRGDVEHLANAPLHVNAARELERLRAHALEGR